MNRNFSVRAYAIALLLMIISSAGISQPAVNYKKESENLYAAIRKNYFEKSTGYYREQPKSVAQKNQSSYLWPVCALFQAEHEMEAGGNASVSIDSTISLITRFYDDRAPAPGYASYPPPLGGGDRFYDDNQWIGITLLDAYARTKNNKYLEKGIEIYRFMMTAYDSTTGGGLYWEEGKPTKNTCSNGPGIILALQIYQATNEKTYLDTAMMLYEWVNKNLQDSSKLFLDNINTKTGHVDRHKYSYNTGTMLQSNVYFYEITNDKKYLDRALEIADAAVPFFYGSGKFTDNLWFNAVMLRGLIHLRKHNTSDKYLDAFRKCTDQAVRQNKNANGLMGVSKLSDLVGQGGMVEILARFANLPQK